MSFADTDKIKYLYNHNRTVFAEKVNASGNIICDRTEPHNGAIERLQVTVLLIDGMIFAGLRPATLGDALRSLRTPLGYANTQSANKQRIYL
ncbi:hypothetical protein LC653_41030 [Nostoc sp. CHAB 5784]|uniref:hypothetical protein n=1 Tax=Nostoc mirabile TaxID=2907820 RepID=UPI001E43DF83|nr:hypothetical protein [Nostoc mirabile]MCC5670015.1 hypothetical protein [Nostoc mirabile CHAB5784]